MERRGRHGACYRQAVSALRVWRRLLIEGELEAPPELPGFDYRDYLARQGIEALTLFPSVERVSQGGGDDLLRAVYSLRSRLGNAIDLSMAEPEAALAKGILLGLRGAIPAALTEDFNRSGISHLVAISGYNVMLIAGFSISMLSGVLGRRWAVVCAMAVIILYAVLAGGAPSVLRATLMALIVLGAILAGRPNQSLAALLLAAALLTVWQPLIIDDVAFHHFN